MLRRSICWRKFICAKTILSTLIRRNAAPSRVNRIGREYYQLAAILEKMGRKEDAQATLAKASRLRTMALAQPSLATVMN